MPRMEPIKLYLKALEEHQRGSDEKAANLLANALGVKKPSNCIRNSLGKLLSPETMPNEAILRIISTEVCKGRDG